MQTFEVLVKCLIIPFLKASYFDFKDLLYAMQDLKLSSKSPMSHQLCYRILLLYRFLLSICNVTFFLILEHPVILHMYPVHVQFSERSLTSNRHEKLIKSKNIKNNKYGTRETWTKIFAIEFCSPSFLCRFNFFRTIFPDQCLPLQV